MDLDRALDIDIAMAQKGSLHNFKRDETVTHIYIYDCEHCGRSTGSCDTRDDARIQVAHELGKPCTNNIGEPNQCD